MVKPSPNQKWSTCAQILPFHVQTEGTETPSRFIGKWPVGLLKNKPAITSDFDEPLPDDLIDAFEGKYKMSKAFLLDTHTFLWMASR
jgi:hypothetical protein